MTFPKSPTSSKLSTTVVRLSRLIRHPEHTLTVGGHDEDIDLLIVAILRKDVRYEFGTAKLNTLVFEMFQQPLPSAFKQCRYRFDEETRWLVVGRSPVTASQGIDKGDVPYTTWPHPGSL